MHHACAQNCGVLQFISIFFFQDNAGPTSNMPTFAILHSRILEVGR